jgi:ATP-dependent DNA ligase
VVLSAQTEPMLAKAVDAVPDQDAVDGGYSYEPKWDGFRSIVQFDGNGVALGSRGAKTLTRYFPELVDAFRELLPEPCILDGEIVVPSGGPGHQRLDWEALSQRIHPAASRVSRLAAEPPAQFIAFDLLQVGDRDLTGAPFSSRRAELERLIGPLPSPVHVTRTTTDASLARRWLDEFEGAGLDGVIAKSLHSRYSPGKRTMLKIKHKRTADVVLLGYRIHTSGVGVGSLLVGLYADGRLRSVGGVSAFTDKRRLELIDELAALVERDAHGEPVHGETERSRFAAGKDVSFVRVRPERVLEVRYDQMEGMRVRHTAQFERWRPDRDPESCTFEQLEVPATYDLGAVLA